MSLSAPEGAFHEALNPLAFLTGRWRAKKAEVFYPTMEPTAYNEEMEFLPTGNPVLQHRSVTWHPDKQTLLHLESGFLMIVPGSSDAVSFVAAHQFGATEVSEGKVGNNELNLESKSFSFSEVAKFCKLTKIHRHFFLKDQLLHLRVEMATAAHPLQDHSIAVYEKISS